VLFVVPEGLELRVQGDRYGVTVLRELHDGYMLLHICVEVAIKPRDGFRTGQGKGANLVNNIGSVVRDLLGIPTAVESIDIPLEIGLRLDPSR
jgi:hypothetical protein